MGNGTHIAQWGRGQHAQTRRWGDSPDSEVVPLPPHPSVLAVPVGGTRFCASGAGPVLPQKPGPCGAPEGRPLLCFLRDSHGGGAQGGDAPDVAFSVLNAPAG